MGIINLADEFERIVLTGNSVAVGMEIACCLCNEHFPHPVWDEIRGMDYQHDLLAIRSWIESFLIGEPPPQNINALFFGLYTGSDVRFDEQNAKQSVHELYNSGLAYTDVEVAGSTSYQVGEYGPFEDYFPEERVARSEILCEIFNRTWRAGGDAFDLGDGFLTLVYTGLVLMHLCPLLSSQLLVGNPERRYIMVGYEEAVENHLLGTVTREGWHPRRPGERGNLSMARVWKERNR